MEVYQIWGTIRVSGDAYALQPLTTFDTEEEAIRAAKEAPTRIDGHGGEYTWLGTTLIFPTLYIIKAYQFKHKI